METTVPYQTPTNVSSPSHRPLNSARFWCIRQTAFGILKRKLDPFNVVLLRPYLKIAPFLGGAYYLAVFFVQQKFRDFFPYAYFGAVAVFVAPALIIVLTN